MNWVIENPFVLSMNFHDGATVANYPFDDFYSKADALKSRFTEGKISKSPDHGLMVHLAREYARRNPKMFNEVSCDGMRPFKDGITNGAEWYIFDKERIQKCSSIFEIHPIF